jgi:HEAT repeat protein
VICELVKHETNAMVLADGITALAHLQDPVTVPVVVNYKDHIDWSVRFAVAFALGQFPEDPISIQALIWLTEDVDRYVRDWAVFSLGVMGDADSPDIRGVLLKRVFDADWDVREEAIVGLAKRRDVRVLPFLREILESAVLSVWTAEAAATILDLPQLPEDWTANDYRMALDERFGTRAIAQWV